MKLILRLPVENLGDPGDVVDVAPGYGRNYLLPQGLAYEASEAKVLPRTNGNGQLVQFKADGVETQPPTRTVPKLYRWLQDHGYIPDAFKWLGWERGLRQRLQTYVRGEAR